jgi:hypothetical protein
MSAVKHRRDAVIDAPPLAGLTHLVEVTIEMDVGHARVWPEQD